MTRSKKCCTGRLTLHLKNNASKECKIPSLFRYSDTSNNGLSFVHKDKGESFHCYKNKSSRKRPAMLLKKRLWHRCFPVNFAKLLRTSFYRSPPGDCFCKNFDKIKQKRNRDLLGENYWYTENFASSLIVSKGKVTMKNYRKCFRNHIVF